MSCTKKEKETIKIILTRQEIFYLMRLNLINLIKFRKIQIKDSSYMIN